MYTTFVEIIVWLANLEIVASSEDMRSAEEATIRSKQNRYLSLSESVTACAAHPFNGTIVAGTKVHIPSQLLC